MNNQAPTRFRRGFVSPTTGLVFDRYTTKKGVTKELWKAPDLFASQQAEIARKAKIRRESNKEKRAATWQAWYKNNRERERLRRAKYKAENKDLLKEKRKAWTLANPEHVRELNRKSKKRTQAKSLEYQKRRYATDPNFRLSRLMRCGIWRMAKFGWKKTGKTQEYIGCTFLELRAHLERGFKPGMSWDNHGLWEIDHITPLSWFDLTDEKQARAAWHYTNLQPLWKNENWTKLNRYVA